MKNKIVPALLALLVGVTGTPAYSNSLTKSLKQSTAYTTIAKSRLLTAVTIGVGGSIVLAASYYAFKKSKPTIMRTRVAFHISCWWNKIRQGADFTCDTILRGPGESGASATVSSAGVIETICDGKKTPLVLGSIPCTHAHIDLLKRRHGISSNGPAMIFTLNEPWECAVAGLSELVKKDAQIIQFRYPTQDFTAPLFIDLLRAVRDLENRDNCPTGYVGNRIALVHCKAGRGRSATIVAAYIAQVIHKAKQIPTVKMIEKYLVACRPQVGLHVGQKKLVADFIAQLQQAGSFEQLCTRYKDAIERRDKEIAGR